MANRYGECAIQVAKAEAAYRSHPEERWNEVIGRLYPTSGAARKKACPRGAFLGLCEAGLVKGIPAGTYAPSAASPDKAHAVAAVALLRAGTHRSVSALWSAVTEDSGAVHNCQMDVVLALWKNGLIAG